MHLLTFYNIYLEINSYTWIESKLCLVVSVKTVHYIHIYFTSKKKKIKQKKNIKIDIFTYTDTNRI